MNKVIIGVDMAKEKFDVVILGATSKRKKQFPNTAQGRRRFTTEASRHEEVHVVMEATGTYHLPLAQQLEEASIPYSIVNPLQIKRFAQMKLKRVKTDASDALLIAQYGQEQKPPLHRMQPVVQQQLKQINTVMEQLVKQRTALCNLAHAQLYLPASLSMCEQVIKQSLKQVERAIARLEAKQGELVEAAYGALQDLVLSVKGVGPRTTYALLAYVGDFSGFQHNKQVSAYIGLNPVIVESGTMQTQSHISKQGNPRLRTLFYLCALSAVRHNKDCKRLYVRLRSRGKKKKVALIAVANKLVRQVFAVVKSGVAFDNDYVEKRSIKT